MSGYLAFDRERVAVLARRLAIELDDLDRDRGRLTDPAAATAADDVRRAIDRLSSWPARLGRIARSGALTDLFSWGAPAVGAGLVVVRDRLPVGSSADALLAASVLAERFGHLDLTAAPPVLLGELTSLLEGADPATMAAFLDSIGPVGLATVLEVIRRGLEATARADPLTSIDVPDALALVRTLGGGLAGAGPDPAWGSVWQDAELVIASELLVGAAPLLSDDELASRSAELLGRVAGLDEIDPSAYWRRAGVTVLATVSRRPFAANDAFSALADDDLAFVLFRLDPGAAGAFAHAATDHRVLSAAETREPVTRLLEAIDTAAHEGQLMPSSTDRQVGDRVAPDWWVHRESRFAPEDPRLPTGTGSTVAPWLPWLLEPVQIAGWQPADQAPTPWELDGDALSGALIELMTADADALALRMAAITFFTGSLGAPAATQQHAAYGVAAIEDAARAGALQRPGASGDAAAAAAQLVGVGTTSLGPIASTLVGFGFDAALAELVPDVRDAVASGEAAGFGIAASLGWIAVGSWRQRRAPDAPPLPPLPPTGPTEPGDRADEGAGTAADALEAWAAALTPEQREEVFELYDRVEAAAAQGTGFSA